MKREAIYKYLYLRGIRKNNLRLYSILFLIRQLFYFFKGEKAFREFGKRALTEHFKWHK